MLFNDKTEAPTPRRRSKARHEGTVARSAELTGTAVMLFGLAVGTILFPSWWTSLKMAMPALMVNQDWGPLIREGVVKPLVFLTCFLVVAWVVGLSQTRFLFTSHPLKFDFQKVNPLTGVRRMFSSTALWALVQATLKAALIGYVGYVTLRAGLGAVLNTTQMEVLDGVGVIGTVGKGLVWRIVWVLVMVALLDYFVQWRRVERQLRMSKQEVKEEHRMEEGDPQVKSRLRRRYRELALNRQIQRVAEATVVVTNPTHVAVALRYDPTQLPAPQLIAKGSDWVAQRLVSEAKKHGVPVVQNIFLARALVKLPLGALLPDELYQAAAEVMAYVYRVKGRLPEVLARS